MDHVYKSQLQSYALKQNMELPVYAAERQGPAHAPLFRCKVTVCGQTFHSQEFCPTLKAAEHAAAKVALASLITSNPEGVVVDVAYKNLLQEIAQKENSLLPVYATSTSGPSHAPTFTSTVEFAGNLYKGEEAKTKKLAEMNAAKVAFMSVKYGHLPNQTPSPSSPCEKQEAANSNAKSSKQVTPSQLSKMVTPDVPSKWIEVHEDELADVLNPPASSAKEINIAASPPTKDTTLTNAMEMKVDVADWSAIASNESSAPSGEEKLVMGRGYVSIPTGQHVVVRPWNQEMSVPEEAEMLFRDDRFVAYRVVKQ